MLCKVSIFRKLYFVLKECYKNFSREMFSIPLNYSCINVKHRGGLC